MLNGTDGDAAGSAAASKPANSKRPRYTKLTQQELDACKPVLDATWATFIFFAITLIMVPVGAVCLVYGLRPVEYDARYDTKCAEFHLGKGYSNHNATNDWLWKYQKHDNVTGRNSINVSALSCTVTISVTANMQKPIFVYYELDGVYQNHRRYVRSRSDVQLKGDKISDPATQLAACQPQLFWKVSARLCC